MSELIPITSDPTSPNENQFPLFTFQKRECLCALLIFVPAYIYVSGSFRPRDLVIIAAFLILITELLNYGGQRSFESCIWLGCFILCTAGSVLTTRQVWSNGQIFLFIHIFFVWWILSRSGKLLEGKSGHLLPADAFNGFIRFPFSNFFLRIRCLFYTLRLLFIERNSDKQKRNLWILPAAALCVLLFALSFSLLMRADSSFADLFHAFFDRFRFEPDEDTILCFILSLPVGAWLFGLIAGTARMKEEKLQSDRHAITSFLERIRKVPSLFWIVVTVLFSLLYFCFFLLQASYLFGAFTRTLPEGVNLAQYAREGFFELCKVMAVNFSLLWLVTRMASPEATRSRKIQAVCLILLLESMLFSVIAFSKLYLYISCFGFTPKRIQSIWLICVLFAGCLSWLYTLLTGKAVFRKWMYFGSVSLAFLTVI